MSVLEQHELRKSIEGRVPKRHHDVLFGHGEHVTAFSRLFSVIALHFGEVELIARREYERGYEDGKSGKGPQPYFDQPESEGE